jgi:ElaB/YqjD/DUF883 family membrane-anchored ribosome-binding protein
MAETEAVAPERTTTRRRTTNGSAASRSATRRVRQSEDDIEAQVSQLQDDLRAITRTLGRMGESRVDQVRSAAQSQAANLLQRGQDAVSGVQDEFGEMEKQIKDTIRAKPLTAVAGAVALGFLMALITR